MGPGLSTSRRGRIFILIHLARFHILPEFSGIQRIKKKSNKDGRMAKNIPKRTSVRFFLSQKLDHKFPFELTTPMHFYFQICDYDPYAAFLLHQCYAQEILSLHEYE